MQLSSIEKKVQSYNIPSDSKIGELGSYKNCISLGWFCGVAWSMGRYGLRGHSGPFDWYFSDFKSVLKVIETRFSDFMEKENLSVETDNNRVFYDNKYGFSCGHDIQHDFEKEYDCIHQKYMRRAEQFMQDIKQPTFFIRAVKSKEEILFIEENREYIYSIIKKENPNNEIAFLILNDMQKLSSNFLWFQLSINKYWGRMYEMRMLFDSSRKFSEYCIRHILPEESIVHNKKFDKEHNKLKVGRGILVHFLNECNDDIVLALKKYYLNIAADGIYLWGAGMYGTLILQYLITQGITVKGIIDNDLNKIGTLCEGIPIVPFSKIKDDSQNIFITIASDQKESEVQKQILDTYPNTKILKLSYLSNVLYEKYGCVKP